MQAALLMTALGGKRAYDGRLGKDRSPRHSCRSIAGAEYASTPFSDDRTAADRARPLRMVTAIYRGTSSLL